MDKFVLPDSLDKAGTCFVGKIVVPLCSYKLVIVIIFIAVYVFW